MAFPRAIKAVIFDMDGLLFDTERLYSEAMIAAASEMGVQLTPDIIRRTVGLPANASYLVWTEHFGPAFDVDVFWAASSARFDILADTDLTLKPGVIELLDLLDYLRLPRAIATSTARPKVDHHLAATGLANRFDRITADGDYRHGKPHPAPYLTAARHLGLHAADCLALEDSYNGVRSAAGAGMMTIMVPDLVMPDDEMRGLAHHIAQDLHEVCEMLA